MQKAINQSGEKLAEITAGPFVTIIEPFEPRMNATEDLRHRIKCAADKAGKELAEKYPLQAAVLTEKLQGLLNTLDYSRKKSILIVVGNHVEKQLYLDGTVTEKILVDDVFEADDLLMQAQDTYPLLLLVLSFNTAKIFLGDGSLDHLEPLDSLENNVFERDLPGKVANFSDAGDLKEIRTKKFFREVSHSLARALKSHPLPVILACTTKNKGYFNEITSSEDNISQFIEGNYEEYTEAQLLELVHPVQKQLEKIQEEKLVRQLEEAIDRYEAVEGINEVLKAAKAGRGRILLLEKIHKELMGERDLIPFVIAQVISYGGEVKFLNEGMLRGHSPVSMILKYKT